MEGEEHLVVGTRLGPCARSFVSSEVHTVVFRAVGNYRLLSWWEPGVSPGRSETLAVSGKKHVLIGQDIGMRYK